MKYIINPQYLLRGWYKSPTGLFDMRKGKTRFFLKEQYLLLLRCNGVDDIDESSLTDANVKFLEWLKKNDGRRKKTEKQAPCRTGTHICKQSYTG